MNSPLDHPSLVQGPNAPARRTDREAFGTIPSSVILVEVGPRDGFQFESRIIPTDDKVETIRALMDAGCRHIQIAAFVHPGKVPQMADAENLFDRLGTPANVALSALVLNETGVRRAGDCGAKWVEVSISASESHGLRNAGMHLAQARAAAGRMIIAARDYGMHVIAGVQCAFGCLVDGPTDPAFVGALVRDYVDAGVDVLSLADTTGLATPVTVDALLAEIAPIAGALPLGLHFHDTRGLGLVNVMTALQRGVSRFDTALGGMGGCPFVDGAAGNIATEDTIQLCQGLGIATGIDMAAVAACTRRLETFYGRRFPGKMHRLVS
ncbi:MAG: hydroxymethylglutaryl-CoA lyase [Pseudomonadota bacterium]